MAVLQDININVHGQPSEKRLQTFLRLSQNENGRMINFRVLGAPFPSNCTATFSGTKPDGNVYSKTGTVTGNFVVIEEDIQMTAVAGVWDAKLDIINGTHNIMTALIRVVVDADVVDPDAIASDSQLQGLVAEAKYYAEHARTDAYGSPLTAPTKAQMTDHTRVYVYTGSEPNMVAGNWYLWNGSAWTSGGVYNAVAVQTDKTLTVQDKAADGKATGDALDALKEDLNDVTEASKNIFDPSYLVSMAGWTRNNGVYSGTMTQIKNAFEQTNYPVTFESGAYTFSAFTYTENEKSATGTGLVVRFKYTDDTNETLYIPNTTNTYTKVTLSSDPNKTIMGLRFYYGSGASNVWYLKDIQLEKGTSATEYVNWRSAVDNTARADLESLHSDVSENASNIITIGNGVFDMSASDFTAGTFNESTSEVNTNYKFRVTQNKNAPYMFPFPMDIVAASGFRFDAYFCDANGIWNHTESGWKTSYTIPQNTYFRLMIARSTDDSSEVANVSTFVGAITIKFVVSDLKDVEDAAFQKKIIYRNVDVLPAVNAASYYGVNGDGVANKYKKFALLVTTDIHGCAKQMDSAVKYLNATDSIDAGICLGDMAASNWTSPYQWYLDAVGDAEKPWYTVIGNHDGGNSAEASKATTMQDVFDRWIKPIKDSMEMPNLSTPYYSFTEGNVTFIVLDCYDVPDTLDGSDFVVSRGCTAYSQAQITWLINTLASVPSGNHVVIVSHYLTDPITVDSGYWTQDGTTFGTYPDYQNMIADIVNAWINGTTLSESYAPTTTGLSTITVSADFTSRGTGIFACYLIGHVHRDQLGHITKYSGQKVVCLAATANDKYQNKNSDLPRALNTKAEDCITVFVVDTSTSTVRLVRVGSNVTIKLADRTKYAFSYAAS